MVLVAVDMCDLLESIVDSLRVTNYTRKASG